MSIIDRQNAFAPPGAPANAFGAAGTNIVLPDQIDLVSIRDPGVGAPLYLQLQVTTAFVGAGASVTFELVLADDIGLTTNTEVVGTVGPYTVAQLAAGARFHTSLDPATVFRNGRRFLGVRARSSGAATSAGAVIAALVYAVADDGYARNYPAVQPFA